LDDPKGGTEPSGGPALSPCIAVTSPMKALRLGKFAETLRMKTTLAERHRAMQARGP
jgi:hypothetical protein